MDAYKNRLKQSDDATPTKPIIVNIAKDTKPMKPKYKVKSAIDMDPFTLRKNQRQERKNM